MTAMTVSLPDAFLDRMSRQLGNELPVFLRAMEEPPVRGIRMNPEKKCQAAERWRTGDRVPWEKNGWYLADDAIPGTTIWHESGVFYLQDPGAMIPARVLNARPGERILDLCAAPGGKATQMGADMEHEGILVCNEPVPKRAQILSRNLERMGITNAVAVCAMPEQLAEKWPEAFDAVLVDAPCSGEGMFRRNPETRLEWSVEKADGCAARQRDILHAAAKLVRPGGRMVYSTCTFNPAENEENAEWFLREHPEWEREAFHVTGMEGTESSAICWPHISRGEGQYAVLMRKRGNSKSRIPEDVSLPRPNRMEKELLHEQFPLFPEATHRLANKFVHIPECPDLAGIRVFRAGIHLGEIHGRTVIPDHAVAISVHGCSQYNELTEESATRYMAGEQVEGHTAGWTVVTCQGIPLGWGKGSGGVIKNHYPKGLRNGRLTI